MQYRFMLRLLTLVLIVGIVVNCEKEQEDNDIDPCLGWPAFKVGNEWEYKITGLSDDSIYYNKMIADSIVKKDNHYYLSISDTLTGRFDMPIIKGLIRCEGDSILKRVNDNDIVLWDLSVEPNHCFKWAYKADLSYDLPDSIPDSVCTSWMEEKDVPYTDQFGNHYTISTIETESPPWDWPSPYFSLVRISKEQGIVTSESKSDAFFNQTLIKFSERKE